MSDRTNGEELAVLAGRLPALAEEVFQRGGESAAAEVLADEIDQIATDILKILAGTAARPHQVSTLDPWVA